MKLSTKIKRITGGIAMFVGFFLVIGGVGSIDYAFEVHKEIVGNEYDLMMITGIILMAIGGRLGNWFYD